MLSKFTGVLKERRLPYFIEWRRTKLINRTHYFSNVLFCFFSEKKARKKITFKCGFHGETGGVFAIASIANLLADLYDVEFITYPSSNYNRFLNRNVRLVRSSAFESELFICDVTCDRAFFECLKRENKKIIVSCHGFLDGLHGLTAERVLGSLSFADKVHFVSYVQQVSFNLNEGSYKIIPNTTKSITKTTQTNNAGCVGNLNEARKNAQESVDIFLGSKLKELHLWSVETDKWKNSRIIIHAWESNKNRIYDSFDVLVFMSEVETFGLVVIEAMSAGVPCVLSNIPAFQQFKNCPGVVVIDEKNFTEAPEILNRLLKDRLEIRQSMMEHFEKNYSTNAVTREWIEFVEAITQ